MIEFKVDELDKLEAPGHTRSLKLIDALKKNSDYEYLGAKLLKISDSVHLEILIVILTCDGVPDANRYGIQYRERLGIVVSIDNTDIPEVWTLRDDFPCLPHMYDRAAWMPNNICLYFEDKTVINRTWTADRFLKRIYWWMEQSAKGELHAADQPVEQLFFESKYELVLPKDCSDDLNNISGPARISKLITRTDESCTFFIERKESKNTDAVSAYIIYLDFPPIVNNAITPSPHTLKEFYEFMTTVGVPAEKILKEKIKSLVPDTGQNQLTNICRTIIIVKVPIARHDGGQVERVQIKAFLALESPFEIGEYSGFLFKSPEDNKLYKETTILGNEQGSIPDINLYQVEVLKMNSKEDFQKQSGLSNKGGKYVLIGLGALGSALIDLWNRAGWGEWTLIDKDHIKPHNLTRHIVPAELVGWNKAEACATHISNSTENTDGLKYYAKDAMTEDQNIVPILANVDLVIDVTTTLDYPRFASFKDNYSRHCSLFITPNGENSVLLLEDKNRRTRLRSLEVQYYRSVINNNWGENHLTGHLGKFISGASCRDISYKMPFSSVVSHAATLSEQIMSHTVNSNPKIMIWINNKTTGAVEVVDCAVADEIKYDIGGYHIFFDKALEENLNRMRNDKLPVETGGLLLGYHDLNMKSIFIVDARPAPLDSIETETEFQRGTVGTLEDLEKARERTANVIDYIGEWHSHPKNIKAEPSKKDIIQLTELSRYLSEDGLPAIQLIIGENGIHITLAELLDV